MNEVLNTDENANEREKAIQAVMEKQMRILRDHVDTIIIRVCNQIIKLMGMSKEDAAIKRLKEERKRG